MSIEWVNRAIEDMRAWGNAHAVEVDADEVRLLCDYASDYLEVNELGDFTPDTFEKLLLDIYPRKVITPPESAGETIAAARTLVDFLQQTGAVTEEVAAAMRARLDEIEPEMPAALADTSRYGMAKSIFSAIGPEALEADAPLRFSVLPDLPAAARDAAGDAATAIPEGRWRLREMYAELGMQVPVAPDLADGDAETLLEGLLAGVPEEVAEREVTRWLARREPAQAADELLAAVVGAGAVKRGVAMSIVDRLGPEAESAVRERLADPQLRPHAIHWLASRRLSAPPLTSAEVLWLSVDMLALTIPEAEAEPERFAENIGASAPSLEMIEEMWRVDHPDVVQVLDLLGRTLPDENLAKAARKAAFKARTRNIS